MSAVLLSALMGLGTLFSLSGLLVLHLHRKQRRLQAAQLQYAPVQQYTYDPATNLYTLIDGQPKVHVYKVGLLSDKKRQVIVLALGMFAVFLSPLLLMPPAEAALSDSMRGVFSGELKTFVTGIMSGSDNPVSNFAWMIFAAFAFILFVIEGRLQELSATRLLN